MKVYYVTNKKPLSHNNGGKNASYKQQFRNEFMTKYACLYSGLPTTDILKSTVVLIHRLQPHNTPDVDNLSKPIVDAFCGVIYVDDSQIITRKASILRLDDFNIMTVDATHIPYEVYVDFCNYCTNPTTESVVLFGVDNADLLDIRVGEI